MLYLGRIPVREYTCVFRVGSKHMHNRYLGDEMAYCCIPSLLHETFALRPALQSTRFYRVSDAFSPGTSKSLHRLVFSWRLHNNVIFGHRLSGDILKRHPNHVNPSLSIVSTTVALPSSTAPCTLTGILARLDILELSVGSSIQLLSAFASSLLLKSMPETRNRTLILPQFGKL